MLAATHDAGIDCHIDGHLPLLVQLPLHMSDFLAEEGYLHPIYNDRRSNVRRKVRCVTVRESDFTPVFVKNRSKLAKILTKDISRSGLGLLSHEQFWPGETMWITLMQRKLHVRIVRCRKLGPFCFDAGGVIESIESLGF